MIHGAVKTGKAVAGIARGTAAGGPYGAAAAFLWENRRLVGKILAAIVFFLSLPLLIIILLPSSIFGDLDDPENGILLNDNQAILENLEAVDAQIQEIVKQAHDHILVQVKSEIDRLDEETQTEIIDPFAESVVDSYTLLAQYNASEPDYKMISNEELIGLVRLHKDKLFSYTSEESTGTKENEDGEQEKIKTVIYTISFVGEDYFADTVFKLNDEQKELSENYAANLSLFLGSGTGSYPGGTQGSIEELMKEYPYEWAVEGFAVPFSNPNWKSLITSAFGYRVDPFTHVGDGHGGLDIRSPVGTDIHASKSGVVITSLYSNTSYGHYVVINHGNGFATLYAHCSKLLVQVGQEVKQGDVIAKVGNTGRTTGPHLHFEVRKDGQRQDPMKYIG